MEHPSHFSTIFELALELLVVEEKPGDWRGSKLDSLRKLGANIMVLGWEVDLEAWYTFLS